MIGRLLLGPATVLGLTVLPGPGAAQDTTRPDSTVSPPALTEAVDTVTDPFADYRSDSGPSLLLIDADTRVEDVDFRFTNGSAISKERLRRSVAFDGPGSFKTLKRILDFVPGINEPELERFSPLTLQKDVVRLRHMFRGAGFPGVRVDYEVALDTASNRVDLTFLVAQGEPVLLGSVDARFVADTLPADLVEPWARRLGDLGSATGERYGEQMRLRLQNEATDWFFQNGYPWAAVTIGQADTLESTVDIHLEVDTGIRARVRELLIEGSQRLSDNTLRREIPLKEGDWYDSKRVAAGETQLYELDLINRALGSVVDEQPRDTTVAVRFRVEESKPRLVWGRVGWRSEAGVAGEAHWSHRDFLGAARTFTTSLTAETGWAALEQARGRSVGLSALVKQPYLGHRSVTGTFGPFVRWRDDFRDRSLLFGVETAAIYRHAPLETFTLQHELSRLRVDDALQLKPIRDFVLDGGDPFAPVFIRSVFGFATTYGKLDNRLNPRSGFLVEPRLQATGPTGISDVLFFRASLQMVGAVPFSRRTGVFLRATGGRLFPYGESALDDPDQRTRALAGLRSGMFTAGGTSDVRGWGVGLVGPKIPRVEVAEDGSVTSGQYVPVGGLARVTGSAELGLPFPFLPAPHGTYVFLDAGRVWSPGGQVVPGDSELAVDPWAFGAGGGLQFSTLVGPLRLGVGYKLNPTRIDLLSPLDVARALANGGSIADLATENLRRWHIHFSIGRPL